MTAVDSEHKPMTLAEWLSAAGMLLAVYVLIGLYWADRRAPGFDAYGIEEPLTYAAHVAAWPILVFTDLDVFGLRLT